MIRIEREPFGVRLMLGPFQMVVGYLNHLAIWWRHRPVIDLYRRRGLSRLLCRFGRHRWYFGSDLAGGVEVMVAICQRCWRTEVHSRGR